MRFDIVTTFPNIFDSYFNESIIKRAREKKIVDIRAVGIRDFASGKYKKLDDIPYGGGAGMVLMAEPILKAVGNVLKRSKPSGTKIVILSAKGKQFNQKIAYDWAKKYDRIVLISGRYEGIDERVKNILHAEEISMGPYVLTDGDVAAMAVVSAVARLIPGVIRLESLKEESHWNLLLKREVNARVHPERSLGTANGLEYPHYTRPEVLKWPPGKSGKIYRVPKVLLSGNHKKIAEWRLEE
ncbi:MAG: hypothetical protein A2122_00570 [Candidatus Liptonbacteria bacterium GWB1_49_6]|uniref:tRNA (guanine-N(1)-)-methyltransferase n=1 Tax=Candidatus Liptonbacteria bacterium GWB1_49_6 TaxID=1798644 RepID=A0A1G2C7N3_9BACT|nr:MAG: hypothetical protein A2122_00570 [Candidatus Liptonbacteria bacterium GWB1_49_6]